jgi:hypothetical protein
LSGCRKERWGDGVMGRPGDGEKKDKDRYEDNENIK